MFYIVHHNIDLVHITSNNDFLKQVKKVGLHLEGTLKDTQVLINVLNKQRPLTLTVTMFGCWAFRIVFISLKDVMGKPSFSFSIFSLFKATISSVNRKPLSLFHQLTQSENKRKWTYVLIFYTCLFVLGSIHHTVGSLLYSVQTLKFLNTATTLKNNTQSNMR